MRRFSLHVVTLLAALALVPTTASAASWATQTVPEPGSALGSALNGVHCTSTTACTGVGRYDDSGNVQRGLAERWNGTAWSTQSIPFPGSAVSAELGGVYCTASNACRAVGTYRDSGNVDRTFGVSWNGTTWTQDTTPNPASALGASLSGIHCTAANQCTAVGSYIDSGGVQRALAQRWNGSNWSTQTTPTPTSSTQTVLTSVWCTASNACTAVGWYRLSGVQVTLAMSWNGTTWSVVSTPNPGSHTGSTLAGISCTGASACTAVGTSLNASSQAQPMAMRWNGAWSLDTVPLPGSAVGGSFSGVQCTSGTHCTAVGYTYTASSIPFSLTEAWDGTNWAVQTAANPAGATTAQLQGVACTSNVWCEAVGRFTNGSSQQRAFAEKWS